VIIHEIHRNNGEQEMPKKPNAVAGFAKSSRRRQLQKAKKNARRNRDQRPPRHKDWLQHAYHDEEEWDVSPQVERIMPRNERERRQTVEKMMLEVEPENDKIEQESVTGPGGLVIEVSTGLCRIEIGGKILLCDLRGSLSAYETGYTNVVAVGDRVLFSQNGDKRGVVDAVLPRRNQISRPDPFYSHLQQTLAANVDQLLIVASWRDPQIWPELVDRYLITAERNHVNPLLCVNKIDLADSPDEVETFLTPYRELDYPIILTSAQRGDGVAALRSKLEGQVTVLAGLSGVGKSTLLTAVEPSFNLRTGMVNEDRHQGRHTTSQTIMLPLGDDGYVIDTPGIREFGLAGLRQRDLIDYYPELVAMAVRCRFSDCSHQHEPGCAVRAALWKGEVDPMRLDNYLKIADTLPR
jgi:ribosome biogenesis GTPase